MDKFIQILSKQNPYTTPDCPHCKKTLKIKTSEFYSGKEYKTTCPHCKSEITFTGISDEVKKLKKQLKDLGVKF